MTTGDVDYAGGTADLPAAGPEGAQFDRRMLEALVCPQTGTSLRYDAERHELISEAARLAFPIRNGIPVMLADEARSLED